MENIWSKPGLFHSILSCLLLPFHKLRDALVAYQRPSPNILKLSLNKLTLLPRIGPSAPALRAAVDPRDTQVDRSTSTPSDRYVAPSIKGRQTACETP